MTQKLIAILLIFTFNSCNGQDLIDTYIGGWSGELEEPNPFLFEINIKIDEPDKSEAYFIGQDTITTIKLSTENEQYLIGRFTDQLIIRVDYNENNPIAFIHTGHHLSHLALEKSGVNSWTGKWNLLIEASNSPTFYLSLDKFDDGNYGASTFFKEPTFHYMWGQEFKYKEDVFEFVDIRSDLNFQGHLLNGKIDLTFNFLNEEAKVELLPLPYNEWEIGHSKEQNVNQNDVKLEAKTFSRLLTDILNDTLDGTHSVIISIDGNIIFEQYFDDFTPNTPHDTRSLTKSFASAITGIAIAQNIIESENIYIKPFFEESYPRIDWSNGKDSITVAHLLTMSSGLDAIDFGLNRTSFANEGNYQEQEDWTEYILSAPMVNQAGGAHYYGSGNPHLLAPILSSKLDERLEFFIHKNLFQPLSITNYRIQTDNKDLPYFGGGWYFTPMDLLKFGQLYLNKGSWEDNQIIPESWVEKSLHKYGFLENAWDKNEYGYLFWHKTYEIGGRKIESIEARGAGGQYLFIVPEMDLVVNITSGNYRNNKGFQPERIMKDYILTEILRENEAQHYIKRQ